MNQNIEDPIICRCEEIRKSEIIEAINAGCKSVSAVKKYTRAGMGACQGRTCGKLIENMLLSAGVNEVLPGKARFPVVPCSLEGMKKSVSTGFVEENNSEG